MKKVQIFLSENFHFLVVKFSVYLNWYVFITGCMLEELTKMSLVHTFSPGIGEG